MPVKTTGAQNTEDLDDFDFDRSMNDARSRIDQLDQDEQYGNLDTQ